MDEVHEDLLATLEAARDAAGTDPDARLIAWATAFREWSIDRPAGFRLVYGDAVPGYVHPDDGRARAANRRLCVGLVGLVSDLRHGPADRDGPSTVDPALLAASRDDHPEIGSEDVALALRAWGRMHGPVSLEVYGHMTGQTDDPAQIYRDEIESLAAQLRADVDRTAR